MGASGQGPSLLAFLGLSALPVGAYYLYGSVVRDFLDGQVSAKALPDLLLEPFFYEDWFRTAARVLAYGTEAREPLVGAVVLAVALAGLWRCRRGAPRALLTGLWVGYLLFGLVFTYHIHTHDYYSLPLLPIVALSLAPLAAIVVERFRRLPSPVRAAGAVLGVGALAGYIWAAHSTLRDPENERRAALYERVGDEARHTTRALFLDHDYGLPVQYHGWLAGRYWPSAADLREEGLRGVRQISPGERLATRNPDYAPNIAEWGVRPDAFIVTDLEELDGQPALKRFLDGRFPVVAKTGEYVIYDLGRRVTR